MAMETQDIIKRPRPTRSPCRARNQAEVAKFIDASLRGL